MKTLAVVLFCLVALRSTPIHADPAAIAEKLNGQWTGETGTFFKRGGKSPLDAKLIEELAADPSVTAIHFDACPVSLEVAQALAKSKTLKSLMIVHTDVRELAKLKEFAKIQTLTGDPRRVVDVRRQRPDRPVRIEEFACPSWGHWNG